MVPLTLQTGNTFVISYTLISCSTNILYYFGSSRLAVITLLLAASSDCEWGTASRYRGYVFTVNKGWSSSLEVGRGAIKSSP